MKSDFRYSFEAGLSIAIDPGELRYRINVELLTRKFDDLLAKILISLVSPNGFVKHPFNSNYFFDFFDFLLE